MDADWTRYKRMRGQDLPATIRLEFGAYSLVKVFKHDFYAATGLYDKVEGTGPDRVVFKIYHKDRYAFLPLAWLGRWLARREAKLHDALADVQGVPRLLARHGDTGLVREFIPGCSLREVTAAEKPDAHFFPELRATLAAVHARGIAHCDLAKPENILRTDAGRPRLIDFQIAIRPQTRLPGVRQIAERFLRYMQQVDVYHLRKNQRRLRPEDFTPDELAASHRKGLLLNLHGLLLRRPYRAVRHFVLRRFLLAEQSSRTA
jgi:serine/threonine protein kinase